MYNLTIYQFKKKQFQFTCLDPPMITSLNYSLLINTLLKENNINNWREVMFGVVRDCARYLKYEPQ